MLRCQLVNPIHLDPALLLTLPQSSERWLLDCGDLHPLNLSDLQQVSTVFLTHAHIDHWIGLDALLRAQLFVPHRLRVIGPPGLLELLQARLAGYAWNLIADSPFVIEGYEWNGQSWRSQAYPCCDGFLPAPLEPGPPDLSLWRLDCVEVNHGVPCLGYRLESPRRYRFDARCPWPPGPWVQEAKLALSNPMPPKTLEVNGEERELNAVTAWLQPLPTLQIGYITDTRLDVVIRERIQERFGPTRWLWCEAAFLESQRDLAESKLHATAYEAALLARQLQCERLNLFHLSRRSQGLSEAHLAEARAIFPATFADREFFA